LEFDLEGIQLSIQKEEKEKFETKIVLENLKYFSKKIGETAPTERPQLFQSLIKSVSYGLDEISLDIFYLPPRYIQGFGNHRAYSEGRISGVGEASADGRSGSKRGRRAVHCEAGEHGVESLVWGVGGNGSSKKHSKYLRKGGFEPPRLFTTGP
jgi:hypothetical protein